MLAEDTTELYNNEINDVELEDDDTDETVGIPQYAITAYGADYDVEGIVRRIDRGDIEVPRFQRSFVWSQIRSSRFIESLLMGLPVPGIFLYREIDSQKLLVIDGQQRLRTLQFFYGGKFETSKRDFILKGLETKFNGLAYEDLTDEDRRRLDDSIIHATIIRQDLPDDNGSSQYFIFERLNTGASSLASQEIRAAVYHGAFNGLLEDLNKNQAWRKLFGGISSRKRDEELVLRFLALYFWSDEYVSPMKGFLNKFMKHNQSLERYQEVQIRELFDNTVNTILDKIGAKAFKRVRTVNAALLDSVMIGIARRLQKGPIESEIRQQYLSLKDNQDFQSAIYVSTADTEKVKNRIHLATAAFSNVE